MAKNKEKKIKEPKIKKEKSPDRGKTVLAVVALILAVAALGGGGYFGWSGWNTAKRAEALAKENEAFAKANEAINKRLAALEGFAAAEKNRESVVIQMEPHALTATMSDSVYLYRTRFSSVRFESGAQASALVKLRVPVTITIFNTGDQTVTVKGAALYPWETIFEEGFRQEALAAQQQKGFFGELAQGERDSFSIAPGESQAIEIQAMLRGVYGHPALEAEVQRFFMEYFSDPGSETPSLDDDVKIDGGAMNGHVNHLFREALAFYCAQRCTRFTLTYVVETGRGNSFSSTCTVPF